MESGFDVELNGKNVEKSFHANYYLLLPSTFNMFVPTR